MWDTRLVKIGILLLASFSPGVAAEEAKQTAQLVLTASAQRVRPDETVSLDITLRNLSRGPFYLSGTISTAVLEPYGNYDLQIKPIGTEHYQTTTKVSSDPMPRVYGRPPSVEEFRAARNIVLLPPSQSIGKRLSGTWTGLTAMPPGKYDVRVVYSAAATLPVALDRPFLTGTIESNVIQIEVLP
jgi:hypothetical protein